ncbi:MAG: hypothetical protein H6Q87_393 [candidate division NC10 bacterium]|nr:hypothetical protein [candidate division NC10 bacterium]
MATIYKEFDVAVPAGFAWEAIKDVGAIHVVTSTTLEGNVRTVTFGNGMVVKEHILSVNDDARRIAYTAVGGRATHHNASLQVIPTSERASRLVWITDLLPAEMQAPVAQMVEAGSVAMKATLESAFQKSA